MISFPRYNMKCCYSQMQLFFEMGKELFQPLLIHCLLSNISGRNAEVRLGSISRPASVARISL